MSHIKLFVIFVCLALLAGCTVTTAKINSGSVGDSDKCDNSVTVSDGVFSATSVCYKDGEEVQGGEVESD